MYKSIDNKDLWFNVSAFCNGFCNGFIFCKKPQTTKVVYSDASNNGYIVERLDNIIARGDFRKKKIRKKTEFYIP